MSTLSTRQKLIQAALELFLEQGINQTTTRQIADQAGVNEATLFRNFGNKYGLLLALLQDVPVLAPGESSFLSLGESQHDLRSYVEECLRVLDQVSNFVRSVIGEADQYSPEHRQALRQRLIVIQQNMAEQLAHLIGEDSLLLPVDEFARILGVLLLGYILVEITSGASLWESREAFLDDLIAIFSTKGRGRGLPLALEASGGMTSPQEGDARVAAVMDQPLSSPVVVDLPATWVHQMIKQARSLGSQDYALSYVLFGAGLRPPEVIALSRFSYIVDQTHSVLQIVESNRTRQVPINQWILGKCYGTHTNNPLTKWLKTRKDKGTALFVKADGEAMTVQDIHDRWDLWWQEIDVGHMQPQPHHAHETWCVEMLMRGISLENLSILTGRPMPMLQAYSQRAREKAAIAAAAELDRKP